MSEQVIENSEPNNRQTKVRIGVAIYIIIVLLILGGTFYISNLSASILDRNTIYYMYTDECSNCQIVKQWMIDNDFDYRINLFEIPISKLDMNDDINIQYFNKATKECELVSSSVGVPFIFHNGSCFVGRIEVMDHLNRSINII